MFTEKQKELAKKLYEKLGEALGFNAFVEAIEADDEAAEVAAQIAAFDMELAVKGAGPGAANDPEGNDVNQWECGEGEGALSCVACPYEQNMSCIEHYKLTVPPLGEDVAENRKALHISLRVIQDKPKRGKAPKAVDVPTPKAVAKPAAKAAKASEAEEPKRGRGRPAKEKPPEKPFKLPKGWEKEARVKMVGFAGKLGMKEARSKDKDTLVKYIQKHAHKA